MPSLLKLLSAHGCTLVWSEGRFARQAIQASLWWSRGDSNPLPLRCERNVLPSELRPRASEYYR